MFFKKNNLLKGSEQKGGGFTMIEIMVAIFVVTVGVLTSYSVVQQIFGYTFSSSNRLTAAFLAQEGVEIVRNIRDTNLVPNPPVTWNINLAPGTYQASYLSYSFTNCLAPCDYNNNLNFLRNDGNVFGYAAGANTKFKRKITIVSATSPIEVTVDVLWQERGAEQKVTVKSYLYDWM